MIGVPGSGITIQLNGWPGTNQEQQSQQQRLRSNMFPKDLHQFHLFSVADKVNTIPYTSKNSKNCRMVAGI
jgi:hypothetical protein